MCDMRMPREGQEREKERKREREREGESGRKGGEGERERERKNERNNESKQKGKKESHTHTHTYTHTEAVTKLPIASLAGHHGIGCQRPADTSKRKDLIKPEPSIASSQTRHVLRCCSAGWKGAPDGGSGSGPQLLAPVTPRASNSQTAQSATGT